MSYDIYLFDPATRNVIQLDEKHDLRGGTYVVGGSTTAELNVTYNYSGHYRRVFESVPANEESKQFADNEGMVHGIRTLYGMTALRSIPIINNAIRQLRADTHPDYWKATEGNAQAALINLLILAVAASNVNVKATWGGD